MRFAFSDDQLLFRDTVRDFLTKEVTPDDVRAAWVDRPADDDGRLPEVWAGLAEMGVIGLTVPEAQGGLGMHELDLVLLLEETGRVALPEPIVETTAVVAPLLASLGSTPARNQAQAWLTEIASGALVATTALAGGGLVPHAEVAGLLVFEDGGSLKAIPGDDLAVTAEPSVDASRRLFSIETCPSGEVVLAEGDEAAALLTVAFDHGALGTAAQLVGLADHLLQTTVEYVKQREQFGVPIGSFQAIKHHLADSLLALEFARPVVYRAAYSMAHGLPTASRDVSMAKCYASDAARLVVRHALQCHGAIGYTVEYDLHLWMKRVWALAASWGDAAHHRARVADAVLGPRLVT